VRYIGGKGEGPGEFAHVGNFGFVGGVHPTGDGIVTAEWEPDQPDGVVLRQYDPYGRVAWETVVASCSTRSPSRVPAGSHAPPM